MKTKWLPYNKFTTEVQHYLFCFSHAGGSASVFSRWQESVSPVLGVCPVQLPGRENRFNEPFIMSFEILINDLFESIKHILIKPFSLFGHSLGGLIAYELAKKFIDNGIIPSFLFVSGCNPPFPQFLSSNLSGLSDEEVMKAVIKYGGTHYKVINNKDVINYLLPKIKADFHLYGSYNSPAKIINIPITAFAGDLDEVAPIENVKQWSNLTDNIFSLELIKGDHFFYNTQTLNITNRICAFLSI